LSVARVWLNDMNWGTPKDSPKMSYHQRPPSWIVVWVGALAIFLIYASFVLVSSPIGATVHGYFYGIGSSEKLDVSGSPINDASIDNKPLKMMKIDEKVVWRWIWGKKMNKSGVGDTQLDLIDLIYPTVSFFWGLKWVK